ncbi:hypothetical protein PRIPAC_84495 [Pristionchus pacificus]|uniref:Uncharacterized protein n=1 Tax=Pristionchus pacificus TaxID=54126 RepID=A0A2A6BGV4_PRIPA|nr:hypothetical protein PRIPAC_84495 [Pristionchus pacificus]|eukprot:PDM65124.1 hypothetical protein PRIPAC_53373 [Pristionchus pacificus]
MANVSNKNQKRKLTPALTYKTIGSMISDLSLYTTQACNDVYEEDDVGQHQRRITDDLSLQGIVSEVESSMSAGRAYGRLMDSDFERSYILVPHADPEMLRIRSDRVNVKANGQKSLHLRDDQSSATSGTSAQETSESESEARTPLVNTRSKQQEKRKDRKKSDSSNPASAAPSHMTVINNNHDLEISKASSTTSTSTLIDSGFDAKISVKRKDKELCKLDLAADVANGNLRCIRINRQTFRL